MFTQSRAAAQLAPAGRGSKSRYSRKFVALSAAVLGGLHCVPAHAQSTPAPEAKGTPIPTQQASTPVIGKASRYVFDAQSTFILQNEFPFHSPYSGPNSFVSKSEGAVSQTYTLFMGAKVTRDLDVYVDPEMARGRAVGGGVGIAGFPNGEVIRIPGGLNGVPLGELPYIARYFARWNLPIGKAREHIDAGENQISESVATNRLTITAGKLDVADIFDTNSYANSPRTQFMNWALVNNAAYDYAADTRGYSKGLALEWVHPNWTLRGGSFEMPLTANGATWAGHLKDNRGDETELEVHPHILKRAPAPAIVRLLAYRNLAHMGNYSQALIIGERTDSPPNIVGVEETGATKYGFGLNFEQPLANNGATGLFGRLGWDNGATESFAFTECDRTASLGLQVAGAKWHRPRDTWSIAAVQNGLSNSHENYLAAGGLGFLLGDGKLSYEPERILETYYTHQVSKLFAVSLDYQFVQDPGYNRDRGPLSICSIRVHWEY